MESGAVFRYPEVILCLFALHGSFGSVNTWSHKFASTKRDARSDLAYVNITEFVSMFIANAGQLHFSAFDVAHKQQKLNFSDK